MLCDKIVGEYWTPELIQSLIILHSLISVYKEHYEWNEKVWLCISI